MIVTIDGPAGAGKSSVAKALAQRLGFDFLDTGAMYRAVAWAAIQERVDWSDAERLEQVARQRTIAFQNERVMVDDQDVSAAIRSPEVTAAVRHVADHPGIRQILVQRQRELAEGRDVVTEGRDQGTVVFADSPCKIFLTATVQERARRRVADFSRQGQTQTAYDQVLAQIDQRDQQDAARAVGPLRTAPDAVVVVTDGMSIQEVVDQLEQIVRGRMPPS